MKTTVVLSMLALLFILPLSAQNITNTLGTGGVFTIKDSTNDHFTLSQSSGNVGIGTSSPASKLNVLSGAADAPPRLQSSGTSGFAAGWDFYLGAVGKGYVGVPDLGAAFGPGELLLFGGVGTKVSLWSDQVRALTIATSGNVGIGTESPTAKLDVSGNATVSGNVGIGTITPTSKLEVRGDIRLGPSGQYRATSGEENLRIVRGTVSAAGNILSGSGFTVVQLGGQVGGYLITFDTPFLTNPTVTLGGERTSENILVNTDGVTTSTVTVFIYQGFNPFHFIAIGPR